MVDETLVRSGFQRGYYQMEGECQDVRTLGAEGIPFLLLDYGRLTCTLFLCPGLGRVLYYEIKYLSWFSEAGSKGEHAEPGI